RWRRTETLGLHKSAARVAKVCSVRSDHLRFSRTDQSAWRRLTRGCTGREPLRYDGAVLYFLAARFAPVNLRNVRPRMKIIRTLLVILAFANCDGFVGE